MQQRFLAIYLCSTYTSAVCADIDKYACQHGTHTSSAHFSKKWGEKNEQINCPLYQVSVFGPSEWTRQWFVWRWDSRAHPPKQQGRTLLLGKTMNEQLYLKKIRDQEGIVTVSVAVAASRGIVMAVEWQLAEFGSCIRLRREWAYHLLSRMKFVRRKATTTKSKHTPENFAAVKQAFLDDVVALATMEDVPP